LFLCEITHLRLRELDVVEIAFADLRDRAFDLGRAMLRFATPGQVVRP
jgi:hypothetical protein